MPGPGEPGADPRLYGLWVGQVVKNADPSGLGRVRWKVPGLVEPSSGWALPLALAAQEEEGLWDIPAPGENVACGFFGGDPTKPFWIAGPWAEGETPFDSPDDKGLRFYNFHLRCREDEAVLEDITTGMKVELKRINQKVTLYAAAGIDIQAVGLVRILGSGCEIIGRPVVPNGNPIK